MKDIAKVMKFFVAERKKALFLRCIWRTQISTLQLWEDLVL